MQHPSGPVAVGACLCGRCGSGLHHHHTRVLGDNRYAGRYQLGLNLDAHHLQVLACCVSPVSGPVSQNSTHIATPTSATVCYDHPPTAGCSAESEGDQQGGRISRAKCNGRLANSYLMGHTTWGSCCCSQAGQGCRCRGRMPQHYG